MRSSVSETALILLCGAHDCRAGGVHSFIFYLFRADSHPMLSSEIFDTVISRHFCNMAHPARHTCLYVFGVILRRDDERLFSVWE